MDVTFNCGFPGPIFMYVLSLDLRFRHRKNYFKWHYNLLSNWLYALKIVTYVSTDVFYKCVYINFLKVFHVREISHFTILSLSLKMLGNMDPELSASGAWRPFFVKPQDHVVPHRFYLRVEVFHKVNGWRTKRNALFVGKYTYLGYNTIHRRYGTAVQRRVCTSVYRIGVQLD